MHTMDFTSVFLVLLAITASIGSATAQTLAEQFLNPHNAARRALNKNIPDLVWNATLAHGSQQYANSEAANNNCRLRHSGGRGYGENLYWSSRPSTPADAVKAYVDEKRFYDYASNTCATNQVCGHYTQVIWKNSRQLGCAQASCPGGGTYSICRYTPPGNVRGQKPY